MTTFTSLTQFVTTAAPGDRYTEDHAGEKRRSITTRVLIERIDDTKVICAKIRTAHHGRNEYICDQVENCYESTYRREVPTEARGNGVIESYGVYDGKTYLAHRETGVTRYSAKNLRAAHEVGVAVHDDLYPTQTETEDAK
jgi:hypothetical protein